LFAARAALCLAIGWESPGLATTGVTAVEGAVYWMNGALTGTVGTVVASVAVAGVGLRWLGGHADWRSGARVLIGCSLVVAAGTIAAALTGASPTVREPRLMAGEQEARAAVTPTPAAPVDPYAGAAYFPAQPITK